MKQSLSDEMLIEQLQARLDEWEQFESMLADSSNKKEPEEDSISKDCVLLTMAIRRLKELSREQAGEQISG